MNWATAFPNWDKARPGKAGQGMARIAGEARQGKARLGTARRGSQARPGLAWRGVDRLGLQAWHGSARQGMARTGSQARQGLDWLGNASNFVAVKKQNERKSKMVKKNNSKSSVIIEQPDIKLVCVEVSGTAPLIQNNFSQKAIEEMLRKHMGLSVQKEKKVPSDCIERAIVKNTENAICIPPTAFKKAMLTASTQIKTLKKTILRSQLFIEGGSIPITYSRMTPRMDMVRTSGIGRTPDVRFRPSFEDWKARMIFLFSDSISPQTVVDLCNRAGNVGIGEWRPEKDGNYGTFQICRYISTSKEINEVRKICRPVIKPLSIPDWAMDAEISDDLLKRIASGEADD